MSKHTPGPWVEFADQGDTVAIMPAGRAGDICTFAAPYPTRADARLMTASPALLHALKAAAGYLLNAKIDLQSGAPKRTALQTIEGGLRLVEVALEKVEPNNSFITTPKQS